MAASRLHNICDRIDDAIEELNDCIEVIQDVDSEFEPDLGLTEEMRLEQKITWKAQDLNTLVRRLSECLRRQR